MQAAVIEADRLYQLVVGLGSLTHLVGAKGVVDDLRGGAALVPMRLADDLLTTDIFSVVDQILRFCRLLVYVVTVCIGLAKDHNTDAVAVLTDAVTTAISRRGDDSQTEL